MRASGIIKFGLAGSFRLVRWLTLSFQLAASMMTDLVCGSWPLRIHTGCMCVCRAVWQAGGLPVLQLFHWLTRRLIVKLLICYLTSWLAGCIDVFPQGISLGHQVPGSSPVTLPAFTLIDVQKVACVEGARGHTGHSLIFQIYLTQNHLDSAFLLHWMFSDENKWCLLVFFYTQFAQSVRCVSNL